jgi:hypothetical protein
MYTQRKRAAAREAEEAPEAAAEEADEAADGPENPEGSDNRPKEESGVRSGADDPQQPSDGTPDTAAESTAPSGTGERVDR